MYINKKGLKPNTHIGVNLKTLLRKDQQAKTGKNYVGVLSRDVLCEEFLYDEHFTFIEMPPKPPVKHNPKVFDGKRISITRIAPQLQTDECGKRFQLGAIYLGGVR